MRDERGSTPKRESDPSQENAHAPGPSTDFFDHFSDVEEVKLDGLFIDRSGKVFPPLPPALMPYSDLIQHFRPNNGKEISDRNVIFLNGIMRPGETAVGDAQELANSGCSVIHLHVSSRGQPADLISCMMDKLRVGKCAPADTLATLIQDAADNGTPLHLVGHSRGALIIDRALREHFARQKKVFGRAENEIKASLSHVRIETYGSGGLHFKDGPQYVHVSNKHDPISSFVGTGKFAQRVVPWARSGEGAVFRRLKKLDDSISVEDIVDSFGHYEFFAKIADKVHGPRLYFQERVPFETARGKL